MQTHLFKISILINVNHYLPPHEYINEAMLVLEYLANLEVLLVFMKIDHRHKKVTVKETSITYNDSNSSSPLVTWSKSEFPAIMPGTMTNLKLDPTNGELYTRFKADTTEWSLKPGVPVSYEQQLLNSFDDNDSSTLFTCRFCNNEILNKRYTSIGTPRGY